MTGAYLWARIAFLVPNILLGLLIALGLLWMAWRMSQWITKPERQATEVLSDVMAATVLRRSRAESLGRILEQTALGFHVVAGSVHLADADNSSLRLVHTVGVEQFERLTHVPLDDPLLTRLNSTTDGMLIEAPGGESRWTTLSRKRLTLIALHLGGRAKRQCLLILGWPTRPQAESYLPAISEVARYSRQVLAEFDDVEQRAQDFQALSMALQHQEVLGRTAAHDLGNKLALAYGVVGLLATDDRVEPEHKELLDRALQQMTVLQTMLDDLKAPQRPLQPERVPVEAIVEMSVGMVSRYSEEHAASFSVDVPPDLPDIWGERIGLLRVLDNLITNAIRHNVDRPALHVALRARHIGDQIEFQVEDNGSGVSLDAQPHLFEFGFQADSTGQIKGHGMGLWSCRRIVEAHGGQIWIESQPDQGTRFVFTLPVVIVGLKEITSSVERSHSVESP